MKNCIYLLFMFLFSCETGKIRYTQDNFPFEKYQKVDFIKDLNELPSLIHPVSLLIRNNLLFIRSYQTDTVFFVFDLPDLNLVHKFGTIGQGPDEFVFPHFYNNFESDELYISGYSHFGHVKGYKIKSEKEYELIDEFESRGIHPLKNDSYILNDSILIFKDTYDKNLPVINYRKDSIVDYIIFNDKDPDNDGSLHINYGVLSSNGDFMVYAYHNKQQIDIFDSSFQLVKSIIGDYKINTYRYDWKCEKQYYLNVRAGKKYFYCIYSGKTPFLDAEDPNREYALEVYTYEGEPVGKYILNKHIPATFAVDEESGYLYGFNGLEDAILYRYKLDIFE